MKAYFPIAAILPPFILQLLLNREQLLTISKVYFFVAHASTTKMIHNTHKIKILIISILIFTLQKL